ncbi:HNH endonuclease [Staphylococcus simiae]|nr:HNH endonuclease [Staphylococcus simiae]MBO1200581.1 HNH endonuclease [Staphylococcus simiae]MBO1202852.1 HNH endonuclease [Staphylococcus simiae]MBO1210379.1 HNH endonuclease [Staphylococcus simiae]MBO1228918.1 HNH endonuclease [Staphylococcus simiae]
MEIHGKLFCEVCKFEFKEKYSKIIDTDFIEAHHLKPVSEMAENETTNINDIVMLCPNCHRMVHRYRPWIKKKESLKKILK